MIKAMMKRALLVATVALGAVAVNPVPVSAQLVHQGTDPLYDNYYFSDATYTNQVGYDRDTCNYYGVGHTATQGTWTPYVQREIWAYCVNGQLEPA